MMQTLTPCRIHAAAFASALSGLALLVVAGCASPPAAVPVPPALAAPAGERAAFSHHAVGVQIYRCAAGAAGAAPSWAFVAPQAQLFADAGSREVLGSHGAGPFWQAQDGSRVTGQVKARADAPQAGAIPWLLLATTPTNAAGLMAPVTHIQRVSTVSGVAPAAGCAAAADVGQEVRVPYTATYVYFVRS